MPLYSTPLRAVTASSLTVYGILKPPAAARAAVWRLLIPLTDTLQHFEQRLSIRARHSRCGLDITQRSIHRRRRGRLRAHGFHHVLRQDAPHHRELGAVRRIVEQLDLGAVLAAEEALGRAVAETRPE